MTTVITIVNACDPCFEMYVNLNNFFPCNQKQGKKLVRLIKDYGTEGTRKNVEHFLQDRLVVCTNYRKTTEENIKSFIPGTTGYKYYHAELVEVKREERLYQVLINELAKER